MALGDTFKAVADPVRRQILEQLKGEPKTAGEIAAAFDLSAATVSYHLKQLEQAQLMTSHREKNFIYYELNASVFQEVMNWIMGLALGGKG